MVQLPPEQARPALSPALSMGGQSLGGGAPAEEVQIPLGLNTHRDSLCKAAKQ